MTLCNNNDQTWFSDTLISARGLLNPSPFTGFPVKPEISTYTMYARVHDLRRGDSDKLGRAGGVDLEMISHFS